MTIGGVLVPNNQCSKIRDELASLATIFGKSELHCNKLNHNQLVRFSTCISNQRILCFAVASFKGTLGSYSQDIDRNHQSYYHKCLQYLFENLARAAQEFDIEAGQIDIAIESGIVDIGPLKKFIRYCQETPTDPRALVLRGIDSNRITSKEKFEESLLQLPDLISHSLFRCLEQTDGNYGVLETKYLSVLKDRFYHDARSGLIVGWGIKAIHSVGQLQVPLEMMRYLNQLTVTKIG